MNMEVYRKSVRVRLCFEERGMLSKAQVDQGLAKSWYLVNADVLSIGQLAGRIDHDYRLRESCPQGVVLEMSGFVLPSAQSTRLLEDSDLVSVRRKQHGGSGGHSRELFTNSLSVADEEIDHAYRIGRGGLLALDEFEKETGGYQSEHSEDEDVEFSLGSGKNVRGASNGRRKSSAKESSGKKRKRSLRTDEQTQIELVVAPKSRKGPEGLDLEPSALKKQNSSERKKRKKAVDGDHGLSQILAIEGLPRSEHIEGGATIEKKKKKKKMGQLVEQTGPDLNSGGINGSKETNAHEARSSKGRKVKSVKETAVLEGPHMKVTGEEKTYSPSTRGQGEEFNAALESRLRKLTPEANREGKKSRKRHDTNQADHGRELLKEKREVKGNDGSFLSDESSPEHANPAEKIPSRSARRKKAKLRWLREQAQNGVVPKNDDVKSQQTEKLDTSKSETSDEDADVEEAEAEEEILPIMVAPGHIRFECDEDVREEGRCASTVVVSYPEVRCKQQGQAWGQEKSQGRYSEDGHYKRSGKMEDRHSHVMMKQLRNARVVADKIDFEKLPLLHRAPGVGDLLAYRLVELTASWTPELSSYRVGKVSLHDGTTKMISMIPVPEYPIHVQQPEDVDEDGQLDEDLFLPPYNQDGTLEVDFSTLMEVRVLEEGPHGCSTAVQANIDSQESVDVSATTVGVSTEPLQPAILSTKVPEQNVDSAVCINLNAASSAVNLRSNQAEFKSGGDNEVEEGPSLTTETEPVLDRSTYAGWQDMLSEEINKKKLELTLRAGEGSGGRNCDNVQGQAPTAGVKHNLSKDGALIEDGRRLPRTNGAPIIRHRYMRTGALGPTMALLRASQVL